MLLSWHPATGLEAYIVLALAGTLGSLSGPRRWGIGPRGGRPLLELHGRRLHPGEANRARAEAWFARWGDWSVFVDRVTPVAGSFVSIPASVLGSPLARYTILTLAGPAIWCFGFAAAGWAVGNGYESLHHTTRFADDAVVLIGVTAIGGLLLHRRRRKDQRAP